MKTNRNWLLNKIADYAVDPAVIYRGTAYSYRELAEAASKAAGKLNAENVRQGQVIAMISDYTFHSIAMLLALIENGNIVVPVTTGVKAEREDRIQESFASVQIILDPEGQTTIETLDCKGRTHAFIEDLRASGHSGLILFSSGSTGKPKAMLNDLDALLEPFKDKKPRKSATLVFLMFDHIGGFNTLMNALATGATVIIPENREVDHICSLIEKHGIILLPTSPTFLNLMMLRQAHKKYSLATLKLVTYGTEAMPESLLARLVEAFPSVRFLQTFGTSETGILKTVSKASDSLFIKIEDPFVEYKIVDGELWLKSKHQVRGYLNYASDSFADGWYRTGDLVEQTPDGYIRIKGRIKELINVGGQKVLPIEVETVLLSMPEIADCLVYTEKNAIMGQVVAADIVLKDNACAGTIRKAVRQFCGGRLDAYKVPVKITVVDRVNFSDRFKKMRIKTRN